MLTRAFKSPLTDSGKCQGFRCQCLLWQGVAQEEQPSVNISDVEQYVLLASAAVSDGTQTTLLRGLQTIEAAIRQRSSELMALKAQHTIITDMIPPEAASEDESDHESSAPVRRFVRGFFLKPVPGVSDAVFVPDLHRWPDWVKYCAQRPVHVPPDRWDIPGQCHASANADLNARFLAAARAHCLWCTREALLSRADVNSVHDMGLTAWDYVHYGEGKYRHAMLVYLVDAGAKPSSAYLHFLATD